MSCSFLGVEDHFLLAVTLCPALAIHHFCAHTLSTSPITYTPLLLISACGHALSWCRPLNSGGGGTLHLHLVCPVHLSADLNKLQSPQEGFLVPKHFADEFCRSNMMSHLTLETSGMVCSLSHKSNLCSTDSVFPIMDHNVYLNFIFPSTQ